MSSSEFQEIGHCGGKVTFSIKTDSEGKRSYQIEYSHSRPVPMAMIAVYALPQGVAVGTIQLGGIGQPWNPPPVSGCFPVFIGSDSEGRFGHECPGCGGYWRSAPWPNVCPYCAAAAQGHQFLSEAQRRYVRFYCETLADALDAKEDADVVMDLDLVADAVGKEGEKPAFYVSEMSQQNKFTCSACDSFNDILGRFGYCSACGTRNDLSIFRDVTAPAIRDEINRGSPPENCVRDAVASFDSFLGQYGRQLAALVPLIPKRRTRLLDRRYQNAEEFRDVFQQWLGIDVRSGIGDEDWSFVRRMFFRRHVYEHNGGEVDQTYLDESGDSTVSLKQHIHETKESAHRLLSMLLRMARNAHDGFHELIPALPGPIKAFEDRKAREEQYRRR